MWQLGFWDGANEAGLGLLETVRGVQPVFTPGRSTNILIIGAATRPSNEK